MPGRLDRINVQNDPVNFVDPWGLYSFQNFLEDTSTYAGVVATGTALSGLEPGAAVFGGISLAAAGLDIALYSNHPYVDVAGESLKMTVPEPYNIVTDKVVDIGTNKLKGYMAPNPEIKVPTPVAGLSWESDSPIPKIKVPTPVPDLPWESDSPCN